MSYPTLYIWPIVPESASAPGVVPDPGPATLGTPGFQDVRKEQFSRGIRFGNVPAGRSDFVPHRAWHVNTVSDVIPLPSDSGDPSGVIRSRLRPAFAVRIPDAVNLPHSPSSDRFGNPIFGFTGTYPPGHEFVVIDDGFWNVQSDLPQGGRGRYVLVSLPGGRALLAGGLGALGPMSGAILFSTSSNSWIPLPDMPTPKSEGAGCLITGSDVFVIGGSGSVGEGKLAYRFVSASNSWLSLTSSISSRKSFGVVALLDGRVFVAGGTGLSGSTPFTGSEIFEPDTNTWYVNNSIAPPIPLYPFDREGYTLTRLRDGSVLLIGGRDPRDSRPYNHVLRFRPNSKTVPGSTGSWSLEQSMSFARYDHGAVLLDDGRVMVAGGKGGRESNLRSLFPVFLGGQFGDPAAISEVEIYDPSDGSTRSIGQMRRARANFAIAPIPLAGAEGRVVVCGGEDNSRILSGTEVCDVETFSWREITRLQAAVYRQQVVPINDPASRAPYRFLVPGGEMTGSTPPFSSSQILQTDG